MAFCKAAAAETFAVKPKKAKIPAKPAEICSSTGLGPLQV